MNQKKFTLIELLVVIVIIAILISILLPSLNRVKHKAKNVECMSNLRQTGTGLVLYAKNNKSLYPDNNLADPSFLKQGSNDKRPMLATYVPFETINCPFSPIPDGYNLETHSSSTNVYNSYEIWGGWRHKGPKAFYDAFWSDNGNEFDILAADWERIRYGKHLYTSHPDNLRQMWLKPWQANCLFGPG